MDNTFDWYAFSDGLGKISCNRIIHSAKDKWGNAEIGHQYDLSHEEKVLHKNFPFSNQEIAKTHFSTGATSVVEQKSLPRTREDKKYRLCETSWTKEKWIYDAVWPYMEEANKASGWRYDIKYAESMQIAKYEKDGYYNFHKDGKSDHLSVYNMPENGYMHDKVRKLSMSVSLNEDFEGGDLEFSFYKQEKCHIETVKTNKLGNVVVFPSYQEHRITPVTKGTKYSLVVWFIGPPFV
jgi:PKHD-type hydroxylase